MKIISIKVFIFLILNLLSWRIYSQDILYKKNSVPLRVIIKEFEGQTIKYTIPGDSTAKSFYITTSALDSLKYSSGKSLDFSYIQTVEKSRIRRIDQNCFNIELVNCFTGKPNLSYERISKSGRVSFVTGIQFNLKDEIYWNYESYQILQYATFRPYRFFFRTGINYFPFRYTLSRSDDSRFSSGLSLIMGSCKARKWDYFSFQPEGKTVFDAALMWNVREIFYLGDHFQIVGAVELSVFPFLTFICPEAGISVSF